MDQVAKFKFESKFKPLPVIWKSLPKAIPEDNRRFWLQSCTQKSSCQLLNTSSHMPFFFRRQTWTHVLVVKVSCKESGSSCSILLSAEILCSALAMLCGTKPVSELTRAWHKASQCTDRVCNFSSSWISSVAILHWQGFNSQSLNMNIWLPPFGSTWSRARGRNSATCAGLAHATWAWLQLSKSHKSARQLSAWPLFFLQLSKLEKRRPC